MFDPKPHLIQLPRRVKQKDGSWKTVHDEYLEVTALAKTSYTLVGN